MAGVQAWLASSLQRQFPLGPVGNKQTLQLLAARGERVSFQACLRIDGTKPIEVDADADSLELPVTVRRVDCVPVPHHNTDTPPEELDGVGHIPGYVPDVLFPSQTAVAAPGETTTFWITVQVPRAAPPGQRHIVIELRPAGLQPIRLMATVDVSEVELTRQRKLRVTQWFYVDALCDWYGAKPFNNKCWRLCRSFMRNYAAHGCDTIYVPMFTPPLDGVKRPTQLLGVKRDAHGTYSFNWQRVKRWITLARDCGIRYFEWTHLFTQWGARNAIRVYEKRDGEDCLLWPPHAGATKRTYRAFLAQFLPSFERFLDAENLMRRSFFHLSDEPSVEDIEQYRKARAMLRDLAPWMKVMDALSDIRFARESLTDMPVPSVEVAPDFAREGIPCWAYFCCGPRGKYLNRLMDTPLPKIRMTGWLLYRFGMRGFLHWGYNYWHKRQTQQLIDPFTVSDAHAWPGWAHGDTFEVYPGLHGPIDSIRWETFAESLQDYSLLQARGVEPLGRLLAPLKDFAEFPKDEAWIRAARKKLLRPDAT